MPKDPNEVGALWRKTSASGVTYMSGTINGVKVVCFENRKQNDKQPDWRVMKSVDRHERVRQDDDY